MFRNDSQCYSQTCDNMNIDMECGEDLQPQCVCDENMYLKDGDCVLIEECYKCLVDGQIKQVSCH